MCTAGELTLIQELDGRQLLLDLGGVPVVVSDTAGIREAGGAVEREGIARTWREVGVADVVLAVIDASQGIGPQDEAILRRLPANARVLQVWNKADLLDSAAVTGAPFLEFRPARVDGARVGRSVVLPVKFRLPPDSATRDTLSRSR